MYRSRRQFLKQVIVTGALGCLPFQHEAVSFFENNTKFGVILGLLKAELTKDYLDALGLFADLGYEEVEFG